jgi:dynein heavy chain, axonemal
MSGKPSSMLASTFGSSRRGGASAAAAAKPRERGIYSDVDGKTDVPNAGPSTTVPSSWGASAAVAIGSGDASSHAPRRPPASSFKPDPSPSHYVRARLATTSGASSRDGAEPKVFAPRERRSGKAPRRVEVERRRREFRARPLGELLRSEGVDYSKAAPDGAGEGAGSLLPLEPFDDTTFEVREAHEWMALGDTHGDVPGAGVAARALYHHDDGSGSWIPCRVVSWDAASGLFTVTWGSTTHPEAKNASILPELHASPDTEGKDGSSVPERQSLAMTTLDADLLEVLRGSEAQVPRIELCFDAEDPVLFAKRVGEAHRSRVHAESLMHYHLVVDCMPTEGVPGLNSEQLARVLSAVNSSKAVRDAGGDASTLLREASLDHQRTMNKLLLDQHIREARGLGLLGLIRIPPDHPALSGAASRPPAPDSAVVPVPAHDITESFAHFSFHSHLTRAEIIELLVLTQTENLDKVLRAATSGSAFLATSPVTRSQRVGEFETGQNAAATAYGNTLRDDWVPSIKRHIRACLGSIGKGAYNLRESNREMYERSKLRKLLNMLNFVLADTLRTAVQHVVADWVKFVRRACDGKVTVKSPGEVKTDFSATLGTDPMRHAVPPLFLVDVSVVDVEGEEPAATAVAAAAEEEPAPTEENSKESEAVDEDLEQPDAIRRVFGFATPLDQLLFAPIHALEKNLGSMGGIVQVERQVMDRLIWSHEPKVPVPTTAEEWVQRAVKDIQECLATRRQPLEDLLSSLDTYLPLLNLDVEHMIVQLKEKHSQEFQLRELKALVESHMRQAETLFFAIPPQVDVGIAQVRLEDVRNMLVNKHKEIAKRILVEVIATRAQEVSSAIVAEYRKLEKQLGIEPADIEQLTDLKTLVEDVPGRIKELTSRMNNNLECYTVLEACHHQLPKAEFDVRWNAAAGPKRIADKLRETYATLDRCQADFLSEMEREQASFEEDLNSLHSEVLSLQQMHDVSKLGMIMPVVKHLKAQLAKSKDKASVFNLREGLFGRDETEYSRLSEINKAFEPYCGLWESLSEWRESQGLWMTCPFTTLDPEEVERVHGQCLKNLSKSVKLFERAGATECLEIANAERKLVEGFRPVIPIVQGLRNQGMRERHWMDLRKAAGVDVPTDPGDDFTLTKVLDLGLADHLDTITKIGERAGKEYQIEVALEKMHRAWDSVLLVTDKYRETGTRILMGATIEQVLTLLDEHVTMTSAMAFSAFKKPFETEIEEWTNKLNMAADVMDEWIKVQRSWLYLQPIFDSPDIQKQLPKEYKRFATVDKHWRNTMDELDPDRGKDAAERLRAIDFLPREKLLERWRESNTFLDLVQKRLSQYLETKRAAFARFYFLSDAELLDILSSTKDPRAVQDHLKKCFEGLYHVGFTEDTRIAKMISEEGEEVTCKELVDPKGKNVEHWMTELERQMCVTIKHEMYKGIIEYPTIKRTDWIQKHPAMCVLNGSQLHWTREIEEGIRTKGSEGVQECLDQQLRQLDDMVALVRGKLSRNIRTTCGALTVLDVHARDVLRKMVESKVSALNDFMWISQMRYYWHPPGEVPGEAVAEGEETPWATGGEDGGDMFVMMVSSHRPYAYEYLGNTFRLVITPLTDKCYMTLMGALQLQLGGAPAGPAGTGKTETTKDLAKALAKQCVVFNCSDGLDYLAMGKFFKGLASCGAWACFDEFNRIDVEVLSVVAQQLMTLQSAAQAGMTEVDFMDSHIKLDPQFAPFITMNPGYAGRTELPDNLKALFRPVAMMVPDYALIGEIMLFSFGFGKALACARKMVATFKLCSEQLSSQDHYDYGMRAVKTVITAAGNLKRAEPDANEEVLLYRALQDVNLPKFLAHDLPLFNGIMSDLFPGIERPSIDYGDLLKAITWSAEKRNLQPVPIFLTKCIQLYETIVVRHGLMVVGPTGGGKSCIIQVLQDALTLMAECGKKSFPKIEKVQTYVMNPKSITMGQLYGEFDPNTHEWQDGILAGMVRLCADSPSPDLKWMIFDGPVDALWIENMNTVLDDNKKLCLVSGEIIKLSASMEIMFEVEDLAVASPATVSRCGMVYTEPTSLGIDPLLQSWIKALPPSFSISIQASLQRLFDTYIPSGLYFLRRYLAEPVPTVDNQLVRSLFNILDTFFEPFQPREDRDTPSPERIAALEAELPALFMFSFVWSVASTVDDEGRRRFDAYLRTEMGSLGFEAPLPEGGMIYDYCWGLPLGSATDAPGGVRRKWVPWMDIVEPYSFPAKAEFSELIIPTKDSVRYKFLARRLILNRKYVLMTGPTGTGKTANLSELLSREMPKEWTQLNLTFSAQTSANQTQDLIDSKMDKRQRGTFGPPVGSYFVLFVDDLNMPQREKYFAQPPIELLRQWCDYGGWYDRKERTFRKIVDMVLCAAMGPPGGGRNPMTARMVRHFNVITYASMDDESMKLIFGTILQNFLESRTFADGVKSMSRAAVDSSVAVYNTVATELLPTPTKPHYTFNLRDLGKVFQGMLMMSEKRVTEPSAFARMWIHECRRVFQDRLVNNEDRDWFDGKLKEKIDSEFRLSWGDIMPAGRLIAGDYMVPGADNRIYEEVKDLSSLQPTIEEYLAEYNADSKTPMKLVLFLDAIEHVSRVSRVLRQPQGNALLLGVGGSGRQSLTRLATHMAEYKIRQVEIAKGYGKAEWREDVKQILKQAGVKSLPTVFLFSDTQIVFEGMVEDINGILNSGDVPNLYEAEDFEEIYSETRRDCLSKRITPTPIAMFNQYLLRVRKNIHIVMCMSPMGDAFRDRLRMFPALVNCCTIDWFSEWPDEALSSVATSSLAEVDLGLDKHTPGVVEMFRVVHQSVAGASKRYYNTLRRYNYVTPTSYLELLNTFRTVITSKRDDVGTLKSRLQKGLDAMADATREVVTLQAQLTEMMPKLEATQKEVDAMIVQIDKDKEDADKTKAIVEEEEASASKMAAECQAIKEDAENDLAKALPALDDAVRVLAKLKKADIDELRSIRTPGAGVVLTMHAACLLFGVQPKIVKEDGAMGKKRKDYWEPAKSSLLANATKFLEDMKTYDKDSIGDEILTALKPFVDDEENFSPAAVERSNKAAMGVCKWVHAMYLYATIAKEVEPKRRKLAQAQSDFDTAQTKLQAALDRLHAVEKKLAELKAKFDEAESQKQQLQRDVELAQGRLERAHKLIDGLSGEKDRWTKTVARLAVDYENLIGDALVSASSIAYLGAFTSDFRADLVASWTKELRRLDLPHSDGCNVRTTLLDPVQLQQWIIAGLPSDTHSVENAIIMDKARRWPLLIDPQGQANRYIKTMGRDKSLARNDMDVLRQSDKKFIQNLENGVRFGKWILLENVGESLDAALEPILLQQTFKLNGADMIKLGESVIPFNSDFRFFITSKLPNPHYPPEVAVKVSLLNFTITPVGLEDQMLGVFIVNELPELEERKNTLTTENARMQKELQDIESTILHMLSNVKGNILDDVKLIDTLQQSKVTSDEIKTQVAAAAETEKEIDSTREEYRPVAFRASILYFALADLANIDPMYQYSLPWFRNLFIRAIRNSEPSEEVSKRILNLNDFFTKLIYRNVCRSLFERHKMLFSFLLAQRIMDGDKRINHDEWRFLISGLGTSKVDAPKPVEAVWMTDRCWEELRSVASLSAFEGLLDAVAANLDEWKTLFDSNDAHRFPLPGKWQELLSPMQRMCVLRAFRPDKITLAVQDFVEAHIGKEYIEPPPFDLPGCYDDSLVDTPLIFVLSVGSDPTKAFYQFAESMGMRSKLEGISLGQGQGKIAERLIDKAQANGEWVLLQNCHLASSWMGELERICEAIDKDKVSPDFRLWLTSMPSQHFPVSVLQNGVKMTQEPPKGLKANIRNFYHGLADDDLQLTSKPDVYRKLLFGLAFFHANVQERRKFGPLGWNVPYEFNSSDLDISRRQLEMFLDEYDHVPYRVLNFLVSYINYGGRVTDDKDLRTIDVILMDYFTPRILEDGYSLSASGDYRTIEADEETPHSSFMQYIDSLPINADPEVFGMHPNANITCDQNDTYEMFDTLLSLQPRSTSGGGKSREEIIAETAADIQSRLPREFDIEAISMTYPVKYEESMNTVLVQECIRYNGLLAVMHRTLPEIQKALKGLVVMSSELDAMGTAMTSVKVPETWEAKAYPSLKPLNSWVTELLDRLHFIQAWVDDGIPPCFWISGFYFPQAFLTGTLQNYARRYALPIDTLDFSFKVLDVSYEELKAKPADGCYIRGLFLEGARWNASKGCLDDSVPKQLYTELPPMHLMPVQDREKPMKGVYRCPVYKVLSRRGTLSTTGHSTNFVLWIELPSDRGDTMNNIDLADSDYWIKAGVAAFCSLKF